MSADTNNIAPLPAATQEAAAADTNTQIQGASAASPAAYTGTLSSLEQLKQKAPEVYNKMLEGIGSNICSAMKAHQERLKELMRKYREQG